MPTLFSFHCKLKCQRIPLQSEQFSQTIAQLRIPGQVFLDIHHPLFLNMRHFVKNVFKITILNNVPELGMVAHACNSSY
jgi:hypothetical protein